MRSIRVEEALWANRDKPVRSTTFERLRLTRQLDERLRGRPQPEQLSEGVCELLDRVTLPVEPHDLLLGRVPEKVPNADEERFFQETVSLWKGSGLPPWLPDVGHECFDWPRIIQLGLPGLQAFAEAELTRRRAAGEPAPTLDWLGCAARVYHAHRGYARRYAQAARRAGLTDSATRCAALADRAPQTFAEALQLIWLIAQVYCTLVGRAATLTLGRLDGLLLNLYRSDVRAGRLTRDQAGEFIEDLYAKANLILGRGEHQMDAASGKATGWDRNLAYDTPIYVLLAGRRPDAAPPANELTELFVERVIPAFENPVVILRYTRDFPPALWNLACEKIRANASVILYNDEAVIDSYRRIGVPEPLATDYSLYACNWPTLPGKPPSTFRRRLVLPPHFLQALNAVPPAATLDDLYNAFAQSLAGELAGLYAQCEQWLESADAKAPGPLSVDDCFQHGPVAQARHCRLDPSPMTPLTLGIVGLATVADCFAGAQAVALGNGSETLDSLRAALAANFEGREDLRQQCLRAPKFGANNARADAHAARTLNVVLEQIRRASGRANPRPLRTLVALTSDMVQRHFGAALGATPDGRRAGEPISDNMNPCPGACTDGLSSMLQSLAQLPFDRVHSGVLNVRIDPRTVAGEEGLTKLAAALRTYFDLGGLQAQLSFANADELRDAQRNPEAHRDLMVRITGYSAVFVDMSRPAQDEMIRRAEMAL